MNRTVPIVIGVICLVLLVIFLIAFFKKILKNMTWGGFLIVIGILLAALAAVAFLLFGPKGNDSILSGDVEGIGGGDAAKEAHIEDTGGTGLGFTPEKALQGNPDGDGTVYLIVQEDRYYIGETELEDAEALRQALQSLKEAKAPVCLVDDYALASAYHKAEEILEACDYHYTRKEQ